MLHPAAPIALLMVMLAAPGGIVAQYTAFAAEAEGDAAKLVAMLKTRFEDEAGWIAYVLAAPNDWRYKTRGRDRRDRVSVDVIRGIR
jgi:hypothetical protein